MVYNYRQYKHVFDTPAKIQQEMAVVNKIMHLLNKNKYDNIEEFISKNPTYQDFLKKNELENVVKHFGNTLNEEDYIKILNQMRILSNQKQSFDTEDIKTTNIGDKEYNTYKGENKTVIFDNSNTDMTIERQMEELQKTQQEFQTEDIKQNTENMINELEKNKKETLNLKYINEINIDLLNEKQKEFIHIASNYQLDMQNPIKIDVDKEIIVDEFDNIMRVERNGEEITVVGDNTASNIEKENIETKSFQKSLKPSLNTIYSENN